MTATARHCPECDADLPGYPGRGCASCDWDGRTCPHCEKNRLLTWREAIRIFDTDDWVEDTVMAPEADHVVCSWCHAALDSWGWWRLSGAEDRARQLAAASSSGLSYPARVGKFHRSIYTGGRP